MTQRNKKTGSLVRDFIFNDKIYHHNIFLDDDRIELNDEAGNTVLVFDSSMNVFDKHQNKLGRILIFDYTNEWLNENGNGRVNGKRIWAFNTLDTGVVINGCSIDLPESHLDLEVEVSKWYLKQQHKE